MTIEAKKEGRIMLVVISLSFFYWVDKQLVGVVLFWGSID